MLKSNEKFFFLTFYKFIGCVVIFLPFEKPAEKISQLLMSIHFPKDSEEQSVTISAFVYARFFSEWPLNSPTTTG